MDLSGFAAEVGSDGPVTIAGAGTRGGAVPGVRCVHAPAGIEWIQADEMTVCCGAGTAVDELAAALRSRAPELPIILITGYSSGAWNEDYLRKQGIVALLDKPLDFRDLLGIIRSTDRRLRKSFRTALFRLLFRTLYDIGRHLRHSCDIIAIATFGRLLRSRFQSPSLSLVRLRIRGNHGG